MLLTVPTERYIREVLPLTHALWGGARDLTTYGEDLARLARTAYIERQERFTVGLVADRELVSSCKLYERELRWDRAGRPRVLSALGIGAVFTPENHRGKGFASTFFRSLLAEERARGRDLAYLFSDIDPAFYARLGFTALPSRLVTLRASSFGPSDTPGIPVGPRDWSAVRGCFEATDALAPWSLTRTPVVWEYLRTLWDASERTSGRDGTALRTLVRGKRDAIAYVFGRRFTAHDVFVIDDYGFSGDEGRAALHELVRGAAGDLTRVRGWLPPAGAREALGRGTVRKRTSAILMVAPLSHLGREWQKKVDIAAAAPADPVWAADHV